MGKAERQWRRARERVRRRTGLPLTPAVPPDRPVGEDDRLAGFDPDEALEEIRELSEGFGTRLAYLIDRLDDWLIVGGRLPFEWAHPEPAVIAERFFRNQPRRTSRAERRGKPAVS